MRRDIHQSGPQATRNFVCNLLTHAIGITNVEAKTVIHKVKRTTLRDVQKAASRERLLDAAAEVFQAVGFRNATVDQIADAAGASRATFYLHFKDKTAVAAGLARRLSPHTKKVLDELARLRSPSLNALQKWTAKYLTAATSSPLMNKMLNEALAWEPSFVDEYHRYLEYIADSVMKEAMDRVPTRRRLLVRAKFILILLMLHNYTMSGVGLGHTDFLGAYGNKAIAEVLKRDFFDEQAA